MSTPLIVPLPGNEKFAARIAKSLGGTIAPLSVHRFPDEETLVRYETPPEGRDVVLICTLDRPDAKFLPLAFAAGTAKDLGARRVGLVAPYLAYMRQDTRFSPGDSVSARLFAENISRTVDWLVTVDPHLHRVHDLSEIYPISCRVAHAAPAIAAWIAREVPSPVIVGPDSESAQWAADVAKLAGADFAVWKKARRGDRNVELAPTAPAILQGRTPVIVDDIISSARTMAEAVLALKKLGAADPVCVGVHAIFAPGASDLLASAGPARIATTNTVAHETNAVDISTQVVRQIRSLLDLEGGG